MADPINFSSRLPDPAVVDIHLILHEKFTEAQMLDAMSEILKGLNRMAGEALVTGLMTTANPVLGHLLNGATNLEQAVLTAKQIQQQGSQLLSGLPMRSGRAPFSN